MNGHMTTDRSGQEVEITVPDILLKAMRLCVKNGVLLPGQAARILAAAASGNIVMAVGFLPAIRKQIDWACSISDEQIDTATYQLRVTQEDNER